jgi:transcriptional regulator with XRE-family HTH domain
MSEPLETEPSLSVYLRQVLEARHMSGNQLAQVAGIAEATVRNLLKQGADPDVPGPHPLVLKAVCEALQLDEIEVFQRAGYLSAIPRGGQLSASAEYFGLRFDHLPPEQQAILWDLLGSLEKASGITPPGEQIRWLLEEVRKLRKAHPMFEKRRFTLTDEAGRLLGNLTPHLTLNVMLDSLTERFRDLFVTEPSVAITPDAIQAILEHPHAVIVLNALLPRKDIPSALEKLFWLSHPGGTLDKRVATLSAEHQAGIRALWELLGRVCQSPESSLKTE